MTSKLILALALAGLLLFVNHRAFQGGRAAVQAEWNAEKLAASEAFRQREKALTIQTQRNDREYQTKKASNLAAANLASERLRVLEAATYTEPKPDNSGTPSGTYGDPRLDIIAQCARTVVILDEAVKRVASQAEALQQYVGVCLAK
jgi:hypothetical protein